MVKSFPEIGIMTVHLISSLRTCLSLPPFLLLLISGIYGFGEGME